MSWVSVVAMASAGSACGSADPGDGSSGEPTTTAVAIQALMDGLAGGTGGPTVVQWDDGWEHVVVVTDGHPALAAVADDDSVGDDDAVPTWSLDDLDRASLSWWSLTDGGARSLGVPPKSLRPVHPADDLERLLLDVAPPGSMLAADVEGAVGERGVRYLRTLHEFYALDELVAAAASAVDALDGDGPPRSVLPGPGAGDDTVLEALLGLDGVVEVDRSAPGILTASVVDDTVVTAISSIEGVADVSVNGLLALSDDPRQGEQWMIDNTGSASQAGGWPGVVGADTNVDAAWEVSTGAGVVVAVVDSGVELSHPDLAGRLWTNPGELCGNGVDDDANGFVDDCNGWDFGQSDPSPYPDSAMENSWHGTHVAGLVAAGRNGVGVVGMAPGATVMPLKVSDPAGRLSTAWVAAAIEYAIAEGADIVNLSLGSMPGEPRRNYAPVELAIDHARANGVLVVTAMGNSGIDTSWAPVWPADLSRDHDNVIAVAASTNTDTSASFSNYGPSVTVWAPGWWLLSTMPGSSHGFSSGTSMASPVVAGAAALVKSSGIATSPDRIRARLVATSVSAGAGPRLDAAAAVGAATSAPTGSQLAVSVAGADSLAADTTSSLEWSVSVENAAGVAGFELLVAARADGVVGAVEGLEATIVSADGVSRSVVSDLSGSLGVVPVSDPSQLVAGVSIAASMALPAADYGFVVRAVDADGAAASDGYVTFVSVDAPASTEPESDPPPISSGEAGGSIGTPPTGSSPAPTPVGGGTGSSGGDGGGSVAPVPPAGSSGGSGSSDGSFPLPDLPAGGGDVADPDPGDPAPSPVAPPATDASTGSSSASSGSSDSSGGVGAGGSPGDGGASAPPSGASGAGSAGSDGSGSGSGGIVPVPVDGGSGGGSSAPPSTTPAPAPATSGDWSLTSMTPRSSTVAGGVTSVLTGRFPTNALIWVWFGDGPSSVVPAVVASETELVVTSPPAASPGVRDIRVMFTTTEEHELRLVDAYTYEPLPGTGGSGGSDGSGGSSSGSTTPIPDPSGGAAPPSGSSGAIGSGSGGSGSTGSGSGSTGSGSGSPDAGSPAPLPQPPDDGAAGQPTPPSPPPSSGSGEPAVRRQLGPVTLRELPAGSALHRLSSIVWPDRGCRSSTCPATRLG